jgi:RNA polymerase sigma-70 factor (ECF subfamily)
MGRDLRVCAGNATVECIAMRIRSTGLAALPIRPIAAEPESRGTALEEEVVSLFDRLREPLLRYLLSFGLAIPDGEEIVQETFLSLFQHLRSGGPRTNLRGWLFRVAHNQGLKRRYRTRRCVTGEAAGSVTGEWMPDPNPGPEEQFLAGETHRRLQAVLMALSEQDRRCLTLRAEGLRYREIAEVLELSLGAVSLSLARALARVARAAER